MEMLKNWLKFAVLGLAAVVGLVPAPVWATPVSAGDFANLAQRCAPEVHPTTLAALVGKESGFEPLVIGVNGNPHMQITAATPAEAVVKSSTLIKEGKSIDLGLGQINSRNLQRLGLNVADAFDACKNLAAASRLLRESYLSLRARGLEPASALAAAISQYNTGDSGAGVSNGYVGAVDARAFGGYVVPAIGAEAAGVASSNPRTQPIALPAPVKPASWDVFGDASASDPGFVVRPRATTGEPAASSTSGAVATTTPNSISGTTTANAPKAAAAVDPAAVSTAKTGPVLLFAEPESRQVTQTAPQG